MRALRPGFGSSSATVAILMLVCALLLHTHFLPRPSMADGPASVHTEEYDAPHPNEAAKPFRASRLALGRGPNPSQASSPERNPALQGGVGAISGMKAGVSDHKGSSDEEEPFLPAVRRVSEQGGLSDGVLLAMGEKKHASATGHTGADNEAFSVFPLHTALEGSLLGAIVFGFPYHELGVPDLAILALIGFLLVWRFTPGPKKTKEQKDIPCNAENRPPSMQLPRKRPHDDLRDAARENAHIPRERESGLPDRKTPQADKADTPLSRHADRQLTGPTDEFGHPPPGHEPENGWDRGHQRSAQGWAKRPGTDGESAVTWPSAHAEAAKKSMSGILPERFELEDFLEGARVFYTRMQEAWAARSTESLAPFMTPEMVRLIRERAATGFQPSSVHIMLLNAELLDLEQREDKDQAKVEFSGLMCVNDGAPTELREVWSFARERNKDGMWRLADMEEREDRQ